MALPDLTPLNLGSIARGDAIKLFEKSLDEIARNIADTDTEAEASRSITITFKLKPESDRRTIHITTSAKTTLAGSRDSASKAFIAKDEDGGLHVVDQDPRQDILFPAAKPIENLLTFNSEA